MHNSIAGIPTPMLIGICAAVAVALAAGAFLFQLRMKRKRQLRLLALAANMPRSSTSTDGTGGEWELNDAAKAAYDAAMAAKVAGKEEAASADVAAA